jgi:AraC-like DNA-binding protein
MVLGSIRRRFNGRAAGDGRRRELLTPSVPVLLQALITGLAQPQRSPRPPARIATLRDVWRWLHDHPATPVTLADLCREAHAGRRPFVQGFRDHPGTGSMADVKRRRLHGSRRHPLVAEPGTIQMGAEADVWGFHNAVHVAADDRRLFGHSPQKTHPHPLMTLLRTVDSQTMESAARMTYPQFRMQRGGGLLIQSDRLMINKLDSA